MSKKKTIRTPWTNQVMPKVGIRPTIDGRLGGVRESLEDQTMDQAKSTKAFIESNLRYPNGEPVQCIIADSCIGGVAEAAQTATKFASEGVGVSLTVTPCWCYGSETMDMDSSMPKAVWGFNGTERPGAVYLAAVLAGHTQKGKPAFGIYGRDVQDAGDTSIPDDVAKKILQFVKGGIAVALMKGRSYLSMGGTSMGIAGSVVDSSFFEDYLGMRVEAIDMTEFVGRMNKEIYDKDEYEKALKWVKATCTEGDDYNGPNSKREREQLDKDWEDSVKMALIGRDLMVGDDALEENYGEQALGHNAIAAGFQGQRQWTDYFPNGDFMEAILNTSSDWNGIRAPYIVATENDALNGVSMLLPHLLTNTAQVFADLRTYWSADAVERITGHRLEGDASSGLLHLINSGPASLDGTGQHTSDGKPVMKPHWEISEEEAKACYDVTTWHPGITEYFPGGGWSSHFVTKGNMPVTMIRINLAKGLGPVLQLAEGVTVELPEDAHKKLDERTNPTWPTTWFAPRLTGKTVFKDAYSVMNAWGANHCVMSYGHIGSELITLASMLRIPVYMHNVNEEDIFRPSSWNAFGTAEPESADYRACETYGPLYS